MIGVIHELLSKDRLSSNDQQSFLFLSIDSFAKTCITFIHQIHLVPNPQANLDVDKSATDKPLSDKPSDSENLSGDKRGFALLNPPSPFSPSPMEVENSVSPSTKRTDIGKLHKAPEISIPTPSPDKPQSSPPSQNGSPNIKSLIEKFGGGSSSVSKSTSGSKPGSTTQSPQGANPSAKPAEEISSRGSLALRPISPESQSKRALSPQLSPPSSPALSPITPTELFKPLPSPPILPSTLSQAQSTRSLPSPRKLEFSQINSLQLSLDPRNLSQPSVEDSRSNEMPRHNGDPILGATSIKPSDQLSRVSASRSNYTVLPDYRREFVERRHRQQAQSFSSLKSSNSPLSPIGVSTKSSPTKSTNPKEKNFLDELIDLSWQFLDNVTKCCEPTKEPMVLKANQLSPRENSKTAK
jgi:hypothetical protein